MATVKKAIKKIKEGFLQKAVFELIWIYRLLKKYFWQICGYTILTLISAGISLAISLQSKELVDGLVSESWDRVLFVALFYVGIGLINLTLVMVNQRISAKVNARVRSELSVKAYDKILKAEWELIIDHHSGDLMTRMQEDIATVAGSTVGWIPSVAAQLVQIMLALVIIVYYDFSMLLIICVVAPILLIGSRVFLGRLYQSNQKQRKVTSDVMSLYKETFQHLQSIKAFNLFEYFHKEMTKKQTARQDTDLEVNKYSIASWGLMYSSGQVAALVCLGWAIYHVYQGVISLGTMTLLVVLANTVSTAFKSFIQLIPTAVGTISASERVRTILEMPEEHIENEAAYQAMYEEWEEGVTICMEHVSFSYRNGKRVFSDVSCEINPGEIVAFVGPSGEGKTTMLRIFLGIVKAEGNYYFQTSHDQLPVSAETRKLIAYVPQGNTMLNGTIAENLRMLKPDASDGEIVYALQQACAYEFVEKLPDGIYHNIGESGIGFSEGQNQRLAIARALMCETPILLLDEATSALDVATERKVLHNLMKENQKRICILTTHRPTVLNLCSRVYRIADQKVIEAGKEEIRQMQDEF